MVGIYEQMDHGCYHDHERDIVCAEVTSPYCDSNNILDIFHLFVNRQFPSRVELH